MAANMTKKKIGDRVVTAESDKRGDVLDNPNETDEGGNGLGCEIAREETPQQGEALATPGIEGALPLGLWLYALECAPEGVELEGEEEVEEGAGEGDEESDGSSWAG